MTAISERHVFQQSDLDVAYDEFVRRLYELYQKHPKTDYKPSEHFHKLKNEARNVDAKDSQAEISKLSFFTASTLTSLGSFFTNY